MTDARLGDVVIVFWGGKHRPAIWVEHDGDRALVLAGTGTHFPDIPHVGVLQRSREGFALKLDKDTFFYARNAVTVEQSTLSLSPQGGRCPPHLIIELARLLQAHLQGRCFLCKTG